MPLEKMKITVLYDAADANLKPPPVEGKPDKPILVHEQIADVLQKKGHQITFLPADPKVRALAVQLEKDTSDVIFNVCESLNHEGQHERHVASLLELLGKPFTGSTALGLSLAKDKGLAKKLFAFQGLPYPKFAIVDYGKVHWSEDLQFPLFVKPLNEDASVGIDAKAVVHSVKELLERISYIHTEIKTSALIEEYIDGREIYVAVLGNDKPMALPIVEWDFSKLSPGTPRFATAEAKWNEDSDAFNAPEICPTDIPPDVYKKIQDTAVAAYRALQLRGYGRVDFRLRGPPASAPDAGWDFFIIEVNPNPYLEKKAEVALAARRHGMSYPQLIEYIVEQAVSARAPKV